MKEKKMMLIRQALKEKQRLRKRNIPKRVETTHGICIYYNGTQDIEHNFFCPNCGKLLAVIKKETCVEGEFSASYCSGCGQALDWSEI